MEFLNAAVRKGRGPHEIPIFPMFCESPSSDMLYVWGYSPTTIEKNRILKDGTLGFEAEFALSKYEAFNNMSIMNDSLFIYFLPDELTIKKYDLTIKKEVGVISFKRDEHKESYFYANRGNVANNEKYIVYPYIFKNRIDIYDLNSLKLSRCITGSKKSPKPVPGDFSSITYHYRYVYAGKDYFYALHGGNENGVLREIRLEVYDYDGNPAKEYLLDIMPDIFVVDEKDSMLYGFNSQYSDHIVKYAL